MLNKRLTVRPMLAGTRITLNQTINRANRARSTVFTCIRFAFKVADALSAQGCPRSLSFGDWASARIHARYSVLPRLPDTFCAFARMRARPWKFSGLSSTQKPSRTFMQHAWSETPRHPGISSPLCRPICPKPSLSYVPGTKEAEHWLNAPVRRGTDARHAANNKNLSWLSRDPVPHASKTLEDLIAAQVHVKRCKPDNCHDLP